MGRKMKDAYWQDSQNQPRTKQATCDHLSPGGDTRKHRKHRTNRVPHRRDEPHENNTNKCHAMRATKVVRRYFIRRYCNMGDRCRFHHPEDLVDSQKDRTHNPIPRTYGEQYPRQRNTDTRKRNKSGRASDNRDRSVSGRHSTQTQNTRREPENRRTRPTTHHTEVHFLEKMMEFFRKR